VNLLIEPGISSRCSAQVEEFKQAAPPDWSAPAPTSRQEQTVPHPFPLLPGPRLTRDDLVNYLISLKANGHEVYQHPEHAHILVLVLGDLRINFVANDAAGTCQVQVAHLGASRSTRDVETVAQLERVVASEVTPFVSEWPSRPTSGRLSEERPATNYRTISQLIGSSQVEGVFDPYLENVSLAVLIDILSFGEGGVANGVRLLGSTKKTECPIPRFTKTGVDAWLAQLGKTGEARVMSGSNEHRRFLLVSGGQSLILGHSLNAIHKNEACRLEPDTQDRDFFGSVWASATPLI
jgi:hypothetical protein